MGSLYVLCFVIVCLVFVRRFRPRFRNKGNQTASTLVPLAK
jgi:hypothetical protein